MKSYDNTHVDTPKLFIWLGVVVLACGLLYTCSQDYKDALAEEAHYCDMVAEGYWPNFKKLDCDKGTGK